MLQIIENLSKQPTVCIIISVLLFLLSFFTNYLLLDSLLKMHRSKSAIKKLKKKYTALQMFRLIHFRENCFHAEKFCKRLITFQKIACGFLAIYLLISLLFAFGFFSATLIAWLTVWQFLLFNIPTLIINKVLSRPIIFGRFKGFSFEKYHNTENYNSLL